MKKTLLIAAAALAAGVISSQAQVYSQNVVGYINITTPAGGYSFVANQLTNGNNNVNNVLNSGLVSDPNALTNSTLYVWNGGGYDIFQWYKGVDADAQFFASGSVTGWYDGGGLLATDNLNQGSGGFLYNPSAGAITTTIVGQVVQGSYTNHVTAGYNVYSLVPPVATNIDSAFSSFPGTSDSNAATNDTMYVWSGAGYNIAQYYTGADADIQFFQSGSVTGWFDGSGANVSTSPAYTPKVGQAFFIQHFGPTKTWTYSFQVQ